jgi:hypothetical protein
LVNLTEHDYTGKFGLGISGNCRMESENACVICVSSDSCCLDAYRVYVRMLPPACVGTSWWDSVISIAWVMWWDVKVGAWIQATSCELDVDGSGGGGGGEGQQSGTDQGYVEVDVNINHICSMNS